MTRQGHHRLRASGPYAVYKVDTGSGGAAPLTAGRGAPMQVQEASLSTAELKRVREETIQRRETRKAQKRLAHHLGAALLVFALFASLVVIGVSASG